MVSDENLKKIEGMGREFIDNKDVLFSLYNDSDGPRWSIKRIGGWVRCDPASGLRSGQLFSGASPAPRLSPALRRWCHGWER